MVPLERRVGTANLRHGNGQSSITQISQTLFFPQWLHGLAGSSLKDYGEAFEEGDIIGTETQKFTKFHQVPETGEVSKLPGNISQTYELCC